MPYSHNILNTAGKKIITPLYAYEQYTLGLYLFMEPKQLKALGLSKSELEDVITIIRDLKKKIRSLTFEQHFQASVVNLIETMNHKGSDIIRHGCDSTKVDILEKIISIQNQQHSHLPESFTTNIKQATQTRNDAVRLMEESGLEKSLCNFIYFLEAHPQYTQIAMLENNKNLLVQIKTIALKQKPRGSDCYALMELINQLCIPGIMKIYLCSTLNKNQQRLEQIDFPENLIPKLYRKQLELDYVLKDEKDYSEEISLWLRKAEALFFAFKHKNYIEKYHEYNNLLNEKQFSVNQFYLDIRYNNTLKQSGLFTKKDKPQPGQLFTKSPPPLHRCLFHIDKHTNFTIHPHDLAQLNTSFKFTPLHYAVWKNNPIDLMEQLNKGVNINSKDTEGNTPLMYAIQNNNFAIVEMLLQNGAENPYQTMSKKEIKKAFKKISLLMIAQLQNKSYAFNPHNQFKIWLSKNPNVFMNTLNQLRLIRMRYECPNDVIHLVYDSNLLNTQAHLQLQQFCAKHAFIPFDVKNILSTDLSEDEKKLLEIYLDEVNNLNAGGNLAAASDILRWIKPIYRLGTYSDFDVSVKTKYLPEKVKVHTDLIFPASSLGFNNDIIAIVDQDSPIINIIQKKIIKVCTTAPTPRQRRIIFSDRFAYDIKQYIKNVTMSTGPGLIQQALIETNNLDVDLMCFENYPQLHSAFFSPQECSKKSNKQSTSGDFSWHAMGVEEISKYENKLNVSAIKMQAIARGNMARKA
jgi:hypothetical protein